MNGYVPAARALKHKKSYNDAAKAARKEKYKRQKHLISQVRMPDSDFRMKT
jgi:hypothetical protein